MASPRTSWLTTVGTVVVLALLTAGGLILAQPGLSPATPVATLLSFRSVPALVMLFALAAALSLPGLVLPGLRPCARGVLFLATGLSGGLLVLIPYENAHLLEQVPGLLHLGLTDLYQVSLLLLAVTGTLALGFDRSHAPGRLLPFITPLLAAAAGFLLWLRGTSAALPQALLPALQNNILPFHVFANFFGYGCFAIAAAAGLAMLVRLHADAHRRSSPLPPVATLDRLAYQAVALGFPVFTLAIFLGCIWAYQAWGGYWSWDPKETWALVVWLTYAAWLHARLTRRVRPALLAWWLIGGFIVTLFCYLGVNMFLSGLHSYGTLQR